MNKDNCMYDINGLNSVRVKLGKRIREERIKQHLTQEKLAESINISTAHLAYIERGQRGITLENLIKLVNRLDVSIDYMLSDSVPGSDENIIAEFKQIIDGQSLRNKQLAIALLKTLFSNLKNDDKNTFT